mgnify:CR=1 FL=1
MRRKRPHTELICLIRRIFKMYLIFMEATAYAAVI